LLDKTLVIQAHDLASYRVALIAADGQGKAALRVDSDLNNDCRMPLVALMRARKIEIEFISTTVVMNDITNTWRMIGDWVASKDTCVA
jgi:hypothetical protein